MRLILGGLLAVFLVVSSSAPAVAAPFTYTFSDFTHVVIAYCLGCMVSPDSAFVITNDTGSTWTDFHLGVGLHPAGTVGTAAIVDADGDGQVYSGPGTYTLSKYAPTDPLVNQIDIVGLGIADGGTLSFALDIMAGESGWGAGAWPTIDAAPPPPAVPEPASLLLLGTGLVGAARVWRKRKT